jgi:hypothetical protein
VIQADFLEHGDPFVYVDLALHILIFHTLICVCSVGHGHDEQEPKV